MVAFLRQVRNLPLPPWLLIVREVQLGFELDLFLQRNIWEILRAKEQFLNFLVRVTGLETP